jgi:adenylosuccinate synthase
MDAAQEAAAKGRGTTLRGIGPAYTDKVTRTGLRVDTARHRFFASAFEAHSASPTNG